MDHYFGALGMAIGKLSVCYFGLPLMKGKLSVVDWQLVIKKVEVRLEMYANVLLRGGCWVLLRSVFSTIPIFYLLTCSYLLELESDWRY